jgi:GWxTD domain-containing protein
MNRRLLAPLLAAAVAAACVASAAAPIDVGTPPSTGTIRFAADVSVAPAADGGGTVSVAYTVNYRSLNFLRRDDGYRARYEVTAILYDGDGRQVTGDNWRHSVFVDTYEKTNSRLKEESDTVTFSVSPGRYTLKLEMRSLDTRASGFIERRVDVPEMLPGALTLGTMVFERRDPAGGAGPGMVLNPTRAYGEELPTAVVRIPIYGAPGTRYVLDATVSDHRGALAKSKSDTLEQTHFLTESVYEFSVLDMEVGSYVIKAVVRPLPDGDESSVRARFRVVTSPLSWGQDQDKMIAQISYVAGREEVERLRSVPPELRDVAWDEFWDRHDPDTATEENEFKTEFLRRLAYANATFSSLVEGWQTDMGRVYIQNGEPDEIESEPVGQMLNAWEIWYYYGEHTKYVFVDREGFGEFILYETSRI